MRPQLPRGQAPAKGILHTERRTPVRFDTSLDGSAQLVADIDPRGYWTPHQADHEKRLRRSLVRLHGRRRFLKLYKGHRRG